MTHGNFIGKVLKLKGVETEIFLELEKGRIEPSSVKTEETINTLIVKAEYAEGFSDELLLKNENGEIVCERRIKNISDKVQNLVEAGFTLEIPSFGNRKDDYFYHTENPRIYCKMTIPVDAVRSSDMIKDTEFDVVAGNKWIDPDEVCARIGNS